MQLHYNNYHVTVDQPVVHRISENPSSLNVCQKLTDYYSVILVSDPHNQSSLITT